jgi:hypothetical protein
VSGTKRQVVYFGQLLRIFLLFHRCNTLNNLQVSGEELGSRNCQVPNNIVSQVRVNHTHLSDYCNSRQQLIMLCVKDRQLRKFLGPSEEISSIVGAISQIFITPSQISVHDWKET